jgi:hypothetical protein
MASVESLELAFSAQHCSPRTTTLHHNKCVTPLSFLSSLQGSLHELGDMPVDLGWCQAEQL